ncbi:clathrin interactor EPSIN 2-like [Curcuma longa]|uniref:clathrin interactor EPSIN 2-like n=1 Tax=Curcuma longa TaxID=136217 RepID=UPI003D9F7420
MKKAFDQTVRDLKRGVNKKVLKVPRIEQKILDATSNEPWGPHGSLLADIAQATMNYHEYQMIMNVIWKRINDTGKNWRHVYKALTVLEYLVGHGSEQVIDNIREHAYQISTLSEFQYIDSSGRDQGNNVRRKSQALVALVNDKERLQEVRQKAAANREKFQSTYSNRPGSHPSPGRYGDHYDDDRYGSRYASRDDYQYGNGKDRDWGYKDDDRSGRVNDSHGREEDRYDRDGYRDNEHRGGDYGSRNMSIGRNRSLDDDNHSIRSVGGRVDDLPQDERQPDRRLSEQSSGAPPSYEEATRDVHNHVQEDRNPGKVKAAAPIAPSSSAPTANSPPQTVTRGSPSVPAASSSVDIANQGSSGVSAQTNNNKNNGFGEFDPRGLASVAPPAASSPEMDLFGSTSASDPIYSLALVPLTITDTGLKTDLPENSGFGTVIAAKSSVPAGFSQPNEDLFGDAPFKAAQESLPYQKQSFAPVATFNSSISSGGAETLAPAASMLQTTSFSFDGSSGGIVYNPISNSQHSDYASAATLPSEALVPQPRNDLPNMLGPQTGAATFVPPIQEAQPVTLSHIQGNNFPQSAASFQSQATLAATNRLNLLSQPGLYTPITKQVSAPTSASASASMKSAPPKDRFETRSTVWADTLSRGLVNLNISGPKINPHADIGVDFDSINRKDKWKEEKKTSAAPLSTTTMGKAMGSGSGIGRVGASVLAAPSNTMIGPGMSFGMRMAMGNYGPSTGMAMNQGLPPQPAIGAPGGGYSPVIMGNYGSQQPYGGGYR